MDKDYLMLWVILTIAIILVLIFFVRWVFAIEQRLDIMKSELRMLCEIGKAQGVNPDLANSIIAYYTKHSTMERKISSFIDSMKILRNIEAATKDRFYKGVKIEGVLAAPTNSSSFEVADHYKEALKNNNAYYSPQNYDFTNCEFWLILSDPNKPEKLSSKDIENILKGNHQEIK